MTGGRVPEANNPTYRFAELLRAVEYPERLLAYMEVQVRRRRLHEKSDAELVALWHEIVEVESDYEARENRMTQTYYRHRDLRAFGRAHRDEAHIQMELDAVSEELAERGIDPLEDA